MNSNEFDEDSGMESNPGRRLTSKFSAGIHNNATTIIAHDNNNDGVDVVDGTKGGGDWDTAKQQKVVLAPSIEQRLLPAHHHHYLAVESTTSLSSPTANSTEIVTTTARSEESSGKSVDATTGTRLTVQQQKPLQMVEEVASAAAAYGGGAADANSVEREDYHQKTKTRADEEMAAEDAKKPSALDQDAIAMQTLEDGLGTAGALTKPEQPREQALDRVADNSSLDPDNLGEGGQELVQATLIRDIDDTSQTSKDGDMPSQALIPTTPLVRDTTGAITVESDMAVVEAKPVEPSPTKTISRKLICSVMGVLLLVIAALSVGFVVSAKRQSSDDSSNSVSANSDGVNGTSLPDTPAPTIQGQSLTPTATPIPVLQRLREGGTLRCGVIPGPGLFYLNDSDDEEEGGEPYGFDASLCAAVAAAATGDAENVEYVPLTQGTIYQSLLEGRIDIVSAGQTHTMERQVYQSGAKAGFSFSVPYLYQGMQLAGTPSIVECGDQGLEYIAACQDIVVCVVEQSTHQQMLSSFLPGQKLKAIQSRDELRKSLAAGECNVIAHEGYNLAESLVRAAGYAGEYLVGRTLFSKEPLAMVTASDDPRFSDFANSIVQALVVAEARNITQSTAHLFEQTSAFGEEYFDMFKHAVAAGGHYGELYAQHLEAFSPRQGLNMINDGGATETGLLYSHPFGSITSQEGGPSESLMKVKQRGSLRCAVRAGREGFVSLELDGNGAIESASGLEIDYCRALAGSIFEAKGDTVEFIVITDMQDGFRRLAAGDVDVLAGATWSFPNDANVPGVKEGFSFTQPYFYYSGTEADASRENLCLATKQDDHLWSSFVFWIAAAIVQAEETGVTQGMSNSMPAVHLFGEEFSLMFQDAILTVGNFGEVYGKNLGSLIPRRGRNMLNGNVGPQLYPIPGLMDG